MSDIAISDDNNGFQGHSVLVNQDLYGFFNPNTVEVKTLFNGSLIVQHQIPINLGGINFSFQDLFTGHFSRLQKLCSFICWYVRWTHKIFPQSDNIQFLPPWNVNRGLNLNINSTINNSTGDFIQGHDTRVNVVFSNSTHPVWYAPSPFFEFDLKGSVNIQQPNGMRRLWHMCMNLFWFITSYYKQESDFSNIPQGVVFDLLKITFVSIPRAGGCNKTKKNNNVVIDGEYIMTAPLYSINNNCLFACFNESRKRAKLEVEEAKSITGVVPDWLEGVKHVEKNFNKKGYEALFLRLKFGLEKDSKINPLDTKLEEICEAAKVSLYIWTKNRDSTLISSWNVGSGVNCHVCLHDEHYYYLADKTEHPNWCQPCFRVHKGKCNPDHQQFSQNVYHNFPAKKECLLPPKPNINSMNAKIYDKSRNIYVKDFSFPMSEEQRKKLLKNNVYCLTDPVYFDFETFPLGPNKEHTCYAVGMKYGEVYNNYFGDECDMWNSFLLRLESIAFNSTTDMAIPLVAYNGSKYDFKLIMRYITNNNYWASKFSIQNPVESNNRIIACFLKFNDFSKQAFFNFWDPCLFLAASLRQVCFDFKIGEGITKTCFPHKLIRSEESLGMELTIEEINNPDYYFDGDKGEISQHPYSLEELNKIPNVVNIDDTINLKELSRDYLRRDVEALAKITDMLKAEIYLLDPWSFIFDFMTIGQFSWAMCCKLMDMKAEDVYLEQDEKCDFIRSSIYGGRVYPVKNCFISEDWEISEFIDKYDVYGDDPTKIKLNWDEPVKNVLTFDGETYDQMDSIVEFDATSLYPSQQLKQNFPTGPQDWATDEELEVILHNFQHSSDVYPGTYEITFDANCYLMQPVLPNRSSGGLQWTLLQNQSGVYNYVDIERALKAGYVITKVTKALLFNKKKMKPVFRKFVQHAKKIKEDGDGNPALNIDKNPTKRKMGKVVINSAFGKCCQNKIAKCGKFCYSEAELFEFINEFEWTKLIYFSPQKCWVGGLKDNVKNQHPNHFGSLILSMARREMDSHMSIADPYALWSTSKWDDMNPLQKKFFTKKAMQATYFYTDTDSFYLHSDMWEAFLVDQKRRGVTASDFGEMKNESFSKGKIIFAWFIQPKTYAYVCITNENKLVIRCASKGVNSRDLKLGDFLDGYLENKSKTVLVDAIKTYNTQNYEQFYRVCSLEMKRSFNKTTYSGRVAVDFDTLEKSTNSSFSLPIGHFMLN